MSLDFTLFKYIELIEAFQKLDIEFARMDEFIEQKSISQQKTIILRHDVDRKPLNSLAFAKIQADRNIYGTYYFRIAPVSFDEGIIREIFGLGHEIGYHYETMDTCRGNVDKAWDEFRRNLEIFRKIAPVKTICMHGSPLSRFDNRELWNYYDYRSKGIIGEPYLDLDFSSIGYLTDTGRKWNAGAASRRDKVDSAFKLNFRTTDDIIETLDVLPQNLQITFHPQRWTNNPVNWGIEFISQNLKNIIKSIIR